MAYYLPSVRIVRRPDMPLRDVGRCGFHRRKLAGEKRIMHYYTIPGLDHYKITTTFDIAIPETPHEPRLLFKNTI